MHDSERMTLAFAKSAAARGARLANYAEVVQFLRDGSRVTGVAVRDAVGGRQLEVSARVVVNASGPWMAQLNALLGRTTLERDIRAFSKGVHIVTRPLVDGAAVALPTRHQSQALIQRGGRHFFIIPWRGRSLIGTTNVPFGAAPGEALASRDDVDTFVSELAQLLPAAGLTPRDVLYAYAGLYPLTDAVIRPDLFQGTGDYQLVDHAQAHQVEGLISALGAKYTTARRVAARTVDLVCRKLQMRPPPCVTDCTPLAGGDVGDSAAWLRGLRERHDGRLPADTIEHLGTEYGTEADAVVEMAGASATGLHRLAGDRPTIEGQVTCAVEREMAVRLDDVVFRRTGLGTIGHPGAACLERCTAIMAGALGWSADRKASELAAVARRFQSWTG
jgi:glycerol-3-phosphate dehydrogenase